VADGLGIVTSGVLDNVGCALVERQDQPKEGGGKERR
jgi:hypothetical protein